MPLLPGDTLGPYRIVEQVGQGGMATVYKAFQPALSRHVAVKVLPEFFANEPGFRERFALEAVAVASLRHPSIPSVHDYGEDRGITYIVTEFIPGGTIDTLLGRILGVDETVKLLAPIASALDYAHSQGVVHRDVKPSNILLAKDGTPILTDFGLAKMMESSLHVTQTGAVIGTPEYMSPEQCIGEGAGPPSDQYSLAVIAYLMLCGQVPFTAATPMAVIVAQLQNPLPLPRAVNPNLSESIEVTLLKGLAKAPEDRFASAQDFVGALKAEPERVSPTLVVAPPKARRKPAPGPIAERRSIVRRRSLGFISALVTVLLLISAGGVALLRMPHRGPAASRPPPAPSPSPSVPVASPSPPGQPISYYKGTLVWQAALDGTGNELRFGNSPSSACSVQTPSGAVVLSDTAQECTTRLAVPYATYTTLPAAYLAELDVSSSPGAKVIFTWKIGEYSPTVGSHDVVVDIPKDRLTLAYAPGVGGQPALDLTSPYSLGDFKLGTPVTIGILVAPLYALFLNGLQLGAVSDTRGAIGSGSSFGLNEPGYIESGGGSVRVSGLRVYSVPPGAAPPTPSMTYTN